MHVGRIVVAKQINSIISENKIETSKKECAIKYEGGFFNHTYWDRRKGFDENVQDINGIRKNHSI